MYFVRKEKKAMVFRDAIERFKRNDYGDFDEFYAQTHKQIFFTALAILRDKEGAEDVLQDTYTTFLERIDEVNPKANIFGYLTVIARNKSLNVIKKEGRLVRGEEVMATLSYESDFYDDGIEQILRHLPLQEDREIITYHVILGYTFLEISKILGKPLGTILWRYNKAIKLLKEKLKGYDK